MNQLFKLLNEKTWKTLLLTEDSLMLVSKSYSTVEEFTEKFHEKGLLKERLELLKTDITKMTHLEKEPTKVNITYNQNGKEKTLELSFVTEIEQQDFIKTIAQNRKMIASTEQVSTLKAIGPSLIGLAVTGFFTFVVYSDAAIIESGGEIDTSGRRSLYKKLFAWLGETLGTQGTIAAGVAIGLICLYFLYKNLKSKPNEIVYS